MDMREHHIGVTRSARYFALGEPHEGVRELWVACHGYGQLAGRFLRHFAAIARPERLIVAPEGLSRFYLDPVAGKPAAERRVGASWMTREDRLAEIDDYVAFLDALVADQVEQIGARPPTVVGLGFSQGVATVARWAMRGAWFPDRLICWSGGLPAELADAPEARALAPRGLTLVAGTRDAMVTEAAVEAERARARGLGLDATVIRFDGGHQLDEDTLLALAAVVAADAPGGGA